MSSRWLLVAALLAGCTQAPPRPEPSMDPGRLEQSFQRQFMQAAEAWNRGDLAGFMADYAPDSLSTYVARGHVVRGFDVIRGHYAPAFAPGARRDSLRFEEFEARRLGSDHALVTARYILYANGRTTASGPFSIVMQRFPDGWKIIHDHSASD